MRRPGKLSVAIILLALAGGVFLPAAKADAQDGVSLLAATSSGVTFEVTVPWQRLSVESSGSNYVQVSIPGWSATAQPGSPMLPQMVGAIGVPFGAVLSVRVEPGPAHTMALPAPVLPAATQKVEREPPGWTPGTPALPLVSLAMEKDPAVYGGNAAYPGVLAEVTNDGVVRQQRVAGIAAYPVQYDPATQQLTVYESLRVEVTFEGGPAAVLETPSAESATYENLFAQQLLNYETARQWRQPVEGTVEGQGASAASLPWAPPVPGWRVKVRADGLYKLTYAELQAAGLPVDTLVPSTFQLYNLGSEVAIYVAGQADGHFDSGDYILFYGQAIVSKYAQDNVYWLTYGKGTGSRMGSRSGAPGGATTPSYYPALRKMESNAYYVQEAPGGDALERWLWDYIYAANPGSTDSWSYTFSLAAPYAGTYAAKLTVALLGYLQFVQNPDHHVKISLNGTPVAEAWWDGLTWQTVQVSIPQGLLLAENNTLLVKCPNDTGAERDMLYVDRAELEFANTFRAEADVLPFSYGTSGTWKYQVDGFSNNQLAVYDVTNPAAVAMITGISVVGSGPYSALFQDTVAGATAYWAMANTAYRSVQVIEADTASNLQATANSAEHIIITHKDFMIQAQQLRDWRTSQGYPSIAVDVQDVYDEFGYGIEGVAPIHDFLAYAYGHWQTPQPSYVVLMGDGHYDPKKYADARVSFIHPYLAAADPWVVETAADNRYVTLVGTDTMPDMMLGRMAVNSSAEASAFVDKIIAYEGSPVPGDWQKQVLAVADNTDAGGNFAQVSDSVLTGYLPAPYVAQKVYYGLAPYTVAADARTAILNGINAGKLIVNYVGHAAFGQWASEGLFKATDVAGLSNGGKLPVMLPMTCYDGFYHYPFLPADGYDCTAELVTRAAGKGAVASWSPTGLGVSTGHDYLDKGFFQAVFQDGLRTLGQATNAGKLKLWATGGNLDLLDTYLLFGDPATRLPLGLFGDVNGDCVVDVVDIMLVAGRWNTSVGDPQYSAQYDLNGDGYIDVADIMLVAANWNTHC